MITGIGIIIIIINYYYYYTLALWCDYWGI
jgi:hypothetical protein